MIALWIFAITAIIVQYSSDRVARNFGNIPPTTSLLRMATQPDTKAVMMALSLAKQQPQREAQEQPPLPAMSRPLPPVVPVFSTVPNAEQVRHETMNGRPSLAGILAIFQKFMFDLHQTNQRLAKEHATANEIIQAVFDLIQTQLNTFDDQYRNQLVFPIRKDESIFLSLAAYREHLLNDTMAYAFDAAKHPDKLYIGTVVQNCFGKVLDDGITIDTTGLPCKRYVCV
jgi:hypothetical protein